MHRNTTLDDQVVIERALRRMRAKEPGIPSEKVEQFLAKIGEEITQSGGLEKQQVEHLLRQLKSGEL